MVESAQVRIEAAREVARRDGWPVEAVRTIQDAAAVEAGCWYSIEAADRVVAFFCEVLRHSKGRWAGQAFTPLEWQEKEILRPLFGWLRPDGTRRYRRAYIEIPKKNGKSTLCAGLGLYLVAGDGEPGAEVYSAAYDREQAGIVYRELAAMVRSSAALSRRLRVLDSKKQVEYKDANAIYRVLSRDAGASEGLNIHGLIFDELHTQKTRDLWDALTYGGAARRQPMLIAITTAGSERNSICYEEHELAEKILDGSVEDWSRFAYIAAAGPDDDWQDPDVWEKANPSWGEIIDPTEFAEQAAAAAAVPSKRNSFLRYRLNIWTDAETIWLPTEKWDSCAAGYDESDLEGLPCWGGLDLASTRDLTAWAMAFDCGGGLARCLVRFWIPEADMIDRERRDKVPYRDWARDGWITITPGNVTDYEYIRAQIVEDVKRFRVREVAFDPWNATQICTKLDNEDGVTMLEHRQGFASMSGPSKEFERRVIGGCFEHNSNPVLSWNARCVTVQSDPAENIKPVKPDRQSFGKRIDGIVALVMAVGRLAANAEQPKRKPRISIL